MSGCNRLVVVSSNGEPQCLTPHGAIRLHEDMKSSFGPLAEDLQLALDCIPVFGGVPLPVAKSIPSKAGPLFLALDCAIRNNGAKNIEAR